jgi:transketolase
MRDQLLRSLYIEAKKNKNIFFVTGDLGFGVVEKFEKTYPKQFINAGVCEQNMTSLACGLAMKGKHVFTYSIGNFSTLRCLEQIRQNICYHNCSVTVVAVGGGFSYGSLGASHHLTEDVAIMGSLPNMEVYLPSDTFEVENIVKNILSKKKPSYIRIDKSKSEKILSKKKINFSNPRIIFHGLDGYIVTYGGIINEAIDVINYYKKKNKFIGLITLPRLKSLNHKFFKKLKLNQKLLIVLEEHILINGISSRIKNILFEENINVKKFLSFGLSNNDFTQIAGTQEFLRKHNGLDSETIIKKISRYV